MVCVCVCVCVCVGGVLGCVCVCVGGGGRGLVTERMSRLLETNWKKRWPVITFLPRCLSYYRYFIYHLSSTVESRKRNCFFQLFSV